MREQPGERFMADPNRQTPHGNEEHTHGKAGPGGWGGTSGNKFVHAVFGGTQAPASLPHAEEEIV